MNDSFLMCRFERFTDVLADLEGFLHSDRTAGDAVGECLAFHKFQYEKSRIVCFLKIVDGCDVRMIECG